MERSKFHLAANFSHVPGKVCGEKKLYGLLINLMSKLHFSTLSSKTSLWMVMLLLFYWYHAKKKLLVMVEEAAA